jgi:tyrosinase
MDQLPAWRGFDRRTFIKGLGYTGLGLVFATLGGCETLCRAIRNRPVRRRLRTGSPEVDAAIATYRNAVGLMKALPASDPRSWSAQAAIHGTPAGFNFCHHGTVHFFSWHRAYLLYFEQICRELTGDDRFGLPYWNWNQDLSMHAAFTDTSSPLFHPRVNHGVGSFPDPFSDATLNNIFPDTNFFSFGSQIEGTPHNLTHGIVGGEMGGSASARDPIFWMHHCMVDYCWAKWSLELGNDNPNDPAWIDTTWDHFVDGDGSPVSVTAGLTTLMPLLSYRYESSAIGANPATPEPSAAELRAVERRVREGADVRFEIRKQVRIADRAQLRVARPFSSEMRVAAADLSALIESDAAEERIFLRVDYASPPPGNDFFVRVFVNLPGANAATPTDDPHYAGSFAFFGVRDAHAGHEASHQPRTEFLVHATDTLRRLRQRGELRPDAPLTVQLVAVPLAQRLASPEAELALDGVDLIVTPVRIRSR